MTDHQLKSRTGLFILITFFFSWTCWFFIYISGVTGVLKDVLITLGVAGPALGAFIATLERNERNKSLLPSWLLLVAITTGSYYLRAARSSITGNTYDLAALIKDPLAISILVINIIAVTWFFVKAIGNVSFQRERSWWLLAVLFFPFLMLIVYAAGKLTGMPLSFKYNDLSVVSIIASVLIAFPAIFFLNAGIEELGWRKFLQESFEQQRSPLVSALFTGLIWGAWHLPLHLIGFYAGGAGIGTMLTRILISICLSIILAWFYKKSGRSVITVMILHTMSNLCVVVFPQNGLVWFVLLVLSAVAFSISGRMWVRERG